MHSELAKRVLRDVRREAPRHAAPHSEGMLHAGDRVGVAVSGGADSLALLRLLEELAGELGVRLAVVHFNHLLRGAESDGDEQFVAHLAKEHQLPFFAGRGDVGAAAREHGWNLEDAGRRLRYEYFASLLRAGSISRIAVAHTADDQAETVLARLIRGTGPAGLAAIYPTHQIQQGLGEHEAFARPALVRPLLGIRRAALRAYLTDLGQDWREDSSNQDVKRLRARLRCRLLPQIESELQPAIVPHLCRLAEMSREDEAFWSILVAERLADIIVKKEGFGIAVRASDLLAPFPFIHAQLPGDAQMAVARRLVRGIVEIVAGDAPQVTAQHVESVLSLAGEGAGGKGCDLPGVRVSRSFEWLWFHPAVEDGEATEAEYSHTLELGALGEATVVAVPEIRRRFRLKVIDWPGLRREDKIEDLEGVLDRDLLHIPLVLRSWRPGDSFQPRGRQGTHKLKQFLRVERVARWDRAKWPVLTSGGELAWVRGLPVAAKFAPTSRTRTGVLITEEEA